MRLESIADCTAMVRRARRVLVAVSIGSALLWAIAGATVIGLFTTRAMGIAAAFLIGTLLIWRDRAVWSIERVALWIEEHHPGLNFALVTAVDRAAVSAPPGSNTGALLARAVTAARVNPRRLLARVALRRFTAAVGAVVVSALVVIVISRSPVQQALRQLRIPALRAGHAADRLAGIVVTVIPPAYSHEARHEVPEPSEISALVGSQLIVHGRGTPAGMSATAGTAPRHVVPTPDGWEVVVTMPGAPMLVRLAEPDTGGASSTRATQRERLLTLIPVADAAPSVELLSPVRDSVMRRATGTVPLRARASDDIGLDSGRFEIVVSSGDEDEGGVHARILSVATHAFADARAGQLQGSLRLDSLQLSPGSVLSIRAIARDGNTVSGPGVGTSDTRTFRIARPDEYDSVSVESAAPNIADSSALSERVVISGTTALLERMARRPTISRDSVASTSQHLASEQDAVRGAITAVMNADDENELPIADVLSAPERALLDSAQYAMSEASARLAAHTPQTALPVERRALAMVDSARSLARRVYLRSRPPRLLVDIAHVRLSGTDHPDPAARTPGLRDTTTTQWLARLGQVGRLLASPATSVGVRSSDLRQAAADSLVVLRVDVLASHPALAGALTRAIDTLRHGGDPSDALGRARALIADPTGPVTAYPPSGGTP